MQIAKGMTRKQLADAIGGKQTYITRWEREVVTPSAKKQNRKVWTAPCMRDSFFALVRAEELKFTGAGCIMNSSKSSQQEGFLS